jgi:hypothetical protein
LRHPEAGFWPAFIARCAASINCRFCLMLFRWLVYACKTDLQKSTGDMQEIS